MSLTPGLSAEAAVKVTPENCASAVGSGAVDVFATPMMIALMEQAAARAVAPHLAEDEVTVGTRISVEHVAGTPPGMTVRAVATLEAVEGRRLVFRVEAFDDRERIGGGTHERYIVNRARFLARAGEKALS
ncbi:thioesterase family protein [Symbiobacterium terraclitae]|uniref:thioesterase family protein n=1 Tax=Symbiobacterium terraclitae TaxID=557451 RepID=UPI0035B527BD